MILKESLMLVLVGIVIGVSASLLVLRLISTMLFDISATDPITLFGATLLIVFVAALAALIPSMRAARVEPMTALRCE